MPADDAVRPLIIICGGAVVDLLAMNERAYTKTRESRSLWITDADGTRELPYGPPAGRTASIASLQRGDGWYAVTLAEETAPDAGEGHGATAESAQPAGAAGVLDALAATIAARKGASPDNSYTAYLFEQGVDKIRKKVGEEAIEVLTADSTEELISESADLLYHLLALLEARGVGLDQVYAELERRRRR